MIFIYRERHGEEEGDGQEPRAGVEIKLIIGKQRNGPTGDVPLVFLRPYVRFENPALGEQL